MANLLLWSIDDVLDRRHRPTRIELYFFSSVHRGGQQKVPLGSKYVQTMKDSIVPSLLDQLDGESNIKMIMVTRYILEIICRKPLSEDVVIQAMDSVAKLEAGGACNWDLRRLDISVAKPYVKALWRYSKSDKDMDSTLSSAVDLQKITMHL